MTGESSSKPRLLFVRHKKFRTDADYMNAIEEEVVTLFSRHFAVTAIDRDFDYGEICDAVQPDLVIVDGPGGSRQTPIVIGNPHARPDIPRVGFLSQDPHDTSRVLFMRLMDELRIERFFVYGTAPLRQSPEMADRAFTVPLYIDSAVFHDYGLEKLLPVSIFGGALHPGFYHWRAETARDIADYFPTLIYTHPGYEKPIPPYRFPVSGEAYARLLNRSHFSLADTTRLDYVVRKHLEIPACGAVLVAPDTPELSFYGFTDMKNCILGSGKALYEKMAAVCANPDLYRTMCRNGHDLVHSRFTLEKWTGLRGWYECRKSLKPGEAVQQQGVFGSFKPAPQGAPALASAPFADNEFTVLMKKARANILRGENLDETQEMALTILRWAGHISEPWVVLGLIALLRGNAAQAKMMFMAVHTIRLSSKESACFDPEEIAWLSLTGAILGDKELIARTRAESASVRHVSLRRMNWIAQIMANGTPPSHYPADIAAPAPGDRCSLHWMGTVGLQDWLGLVTNILTASGISLSASLPPQKERAT